MSKLQNIILNHLPKEFEMENQTNIEKHYRLGFNHCLQEIIQALPEIEKEIVGEINRRKFGEWFFKKQREQTRQIIEEMNLDTKDITLSSLTKDNVSKQSNHN